MLPGASVQQAWDREYSEGYWEWLNSIQEVNRYALILGHLARRRGNPSLLDVGCGAGRLLDFIWCLPFEHYLGIDLSEEAIRQARTRDVPNAQFEVAAAESFVPDRRFDVLVFNEVVSYLKDPCAVMLRYQQYLNEGGLTIVSMVNLSLMGLVWKKLARGFDVVETATVQNGFKQAWTVRLLRPRVTRVERRAPVGDAWEGRAGKPSP